MKIISTKNNSFNNAAATVDAISVVSSFHEMTSKSSIAAISTATEIEEDLEKNKIHMKCTCNGDVPSIPGSLWLRQKNTGMINICFDFKSLTRLLFNEMAGAA